MVDYREESEDEDEVVYGDASERLQLPIGEESAGVRWSLRLDNDNRSTGYRTLRNKVALFA